MAAEHEEQRARIVLNRYGIVFRELLSHELPALRWSAVISSLRRLELGGEVIGGRFIAGTSGIEFATPAALAALDQANAQTRESETGQELPHDTGSQPAWWCSALDPVAATGLGLDSLAMLPARRAGTWLFWHGAQLALVTTGNGKRWTTHCHQATSAGHRFSVFRCYS